MSAHRAPGDLWKSRRLRLAVAGCAAAAVLAAVGWALLDRPDPTEAADRAADRNVIVPAAESPSAGASPAEPPSAAPTPPPSASPGPSSPAARPPTKSAPGKPAGGPGQTQKFNVTLYGGKDNDPPGS